MPVARVLVGFVRSGLTLKAAADALVLVVPPTDIGVARSDLGNIPAFYGKPVLPIVLDLTIVPAPHTLSSGAVFYPPEPGPAPPIPDSSHPVPALVCY